MKLVDQPGGYLDNQAIKILLPSKFKPVESALRSGGQGPKIDAFVDSMNHAAESAAPEAEHIFADAVKAMTIEDARALLSGKDTAITDYFKQKTSANLTAAFKPHVETAMNANGVTSNTRRCPRRCRAYPLAAAAPAALTSTTMWSRRRSPACSTCWDSRKGNSD